MHPGKSEIDWNPWVPEGPNGASSELNELGEKVISSGSLIRSDQTKGVSIGPPVHRRRGRLRVAYIEPVVSLAHTWLDLVLDL